MSRIRPNVFSPSFHSDADETSGDVPKHRRGHWDNPVEFVLACTGYAVGLGNVWRFPYLCYKNGGGAFLIPYLISLLLAGLPLFYLELCLGQFVSFGPNCIFGKISPIMQGLGWGMVAMSLMGSLYYNVLIAWILFYIGASFTTELPWTNCQQAWNTENCFSTADNASCGPDMTFFNRSCVNRTDMNLTAWEIQRKSPSEDYFDRYVLNISDGFHDIGPIQWKLVLCLGIAWFLVFLCLYQGIKSTGKVVYFTATFPYVVLLIFLIVGITLPGAMNGLEFYITPNTSKLYDMEVWKDAAAQVMFSYATGWGGLLTFASYNKFSNNCHRDTFIVVLVNLATSLFSGFVIFAMVGFMAHELQTDVGKVVKEATGLAFIAYPEAIARLPFNFLWSILFFFMLLTLGLDSQFGTVETVTTAVMDQFPGLRKRNMLVSFGNCALCFLLGLPLCTRGGVYLFTVMDGNLATYSLLIMALCEVVTVAYFYGLRNFLHDIELMMGIKSKWYSRVIGYNGWYFRITWFFLTPLYLVGILILKIVHRKPTTYKEQVIAHPAEELGWLLPCLSLMWVPIFAIFRIVESCVKGKKFAESVYRCINHSMEVHSDESVTY